MGVTPWHTKPPTNPLFGSRGEALHENPSKSCVEEYNTGILQSYISFPLRCTLLTPKVSTSLRWSLFQDGEIVKTSREFILSDHTLNSHNLSDGLSIDIRRRNFMLIHY